MIPQEHSLLWDKIRNFPIDDGSATITFSSKLAASQNWTAAFTQKAIDEYRKFIFLCCILEGGAAPSKSVDEVWHLHLTYTRSYWIDLCRNTLGKDIHHYPSTGGSKEEARHRLWHTETLGAYREVFGSDAPAEIWQGNADEARGPQGISFSWNASTIAAVLVLLLPFLFIWIRYNTLTPLSLGGPHFLVFFPVFGIAVIVAYVLYRTDVSWQVSRLVKASFSDDVSPFQVASLLYGKHRALQAAIVDLMNRGLLDFDNNNRFIVKKDNYSPDAGEVNPLIPAYEEAGDGSTYSYEELMGNWYDRSKFTDPFLAGLERLSDKPEPFFPGYVLHAVFILVAGGRMIQGILNDKPIGNLVGELFLIAIVFIFITRLYSRKRLVREKADKFFKNHLKRGEDVKAQLVSKYVLQGPPAISGFAEGALLVGIFAAYAPEGLQDKNTWSSSSSSSDGSGSSCGGGSSCGSSCGGCGGGD